MDTALRTRLLATVTAGTLVGVLGGTGIAFAEHGAAPEAEVRPAATCQSLSFAGERFEGMWFGHTGQAAQ